MIAKIGTGAHIYTHNKINLFDIYHRCRCRVCHLYIKYKRTQMMWHVFVCWASAGFAAPFCQAMTFCTLLAPGMRTSFIDLTIVCSIIVLVQYQVNTICGWVGVCKEENAKLHHKENEYGIYICGNFSTKVIVLVSTTAAAAAASIIAFTKGEKKISKTCKIRNIDNHKTEGKNCGDVQLRQEKKVRNRK